MREGACRCVVGQEMLGQIVESGNEAPHRRFPKEPGSGASSAELVVEQEESAIAVVRVQS